MKKIFAVLAVASLLTFNYSCKKAADATTDAVESTADATGDALNDAGDAITDAGDSVADAGSDLVNQAKDALGLAEVPSFDNAELQSWAQELVTTASSLKTASSTGDEAAQTTAQNKIAELASKMTEFKDSPEFAKAQKLYNDVSAALGASE